MYGYSVSAGAGWPAGRLAGQGRMYMYVAAKRSKWIISDPFINLVDHCLPHLLQFVDGSHDLWNSNDAAMTFFCC